MLSKDARAGVRLNDERERFVIPPVVSRVGTVPRADVVKVCREVCVGGLVRRRKAVCPVIEAEGEDRGSDGLVNRVIRRGEGQQMFEVL